MDGAIRAVFRSLFKEANTRIIINPGLRKSRMPLRQSRLSAMVTRPTWGGPYARSDRDHVSRKLSDAEREGINIDRGRIVL